MGFTEIFRSILAAGLMTAVLAFNRVWAQVCVAPAFGPYTGSVWETRDLPNNGEILLRTAVGLFRFGGHEVVEVPGPNTGAITSWGDLPGDQLLLQAEQGWFLFDGSKLVSIVGPNTRSVLEWGRIPDVHTPLLRTSQGLFLVNDHRITPAPGPDTGAILAWRRAPGGTVLLYTEQGLFRFDGQEIAMLPDLHMGSLWKWDNVPNSNDLLLGTSTGLFRFNGQEIKRVPGAVTGGISSWHGASGGNVLLHTEQGLYNFDGREIKIVGGQEIGVMWMWGESLDSGVLIQTERGLFHFDGHLISLITTLDIGSIREWRVTMDKVGLLLRSERGFFRFSGRNLIAVPAPNTGIIRDWHELANDGLLLLAEKGLFRFDGNVISAVPGPNTDTIYNWRQYSGNNDLLLATAQGLFRFDGQKIIKIPGHATGGVWRWWEMPGGNGLLLLASKGFFRFDEREVTLIPSGYTGLVGDVRESPNGDGLILQADQGLFVASTVPFIRARSRIVRSEAIGARAADNAQRPVEWELDNHPCITNAGRQGLMIEPIDPKGQVRQRVRALDLRWEENRAVFQSNIVFDQPGRWSLQVVSTATEPPQSLGSPQIIIIPAQENIFRNYLLSWWNIPLFGGTLLLFNIALFLAARRSTWALRLATDDGWGKVLTLPLMVVRLLPSAQLWLLNLYITGARTRQGKDPAAYLPLPLANGPRVVPADAGLLALWHGARHLWVQGRVGMGKTALVRALDRAQFAGATHSAAALIKRDGFVLVPIEARNFSEAGGDKDSPAWLVKAVTATLAARGFAPQGSGLVTAMLKSGVLGVAVDGLNEVARRPDVLAFLRDYGSAPLLVTSQEEGEPPFETWRLPQDIREHAASLLRLYLGDDAGGVVQARIKANGLLGHLRSGYDVSLVADLARSAPEAALLPGDRLGLYAEVVRAAWPEGEDRLPLLQAAAWKVMSERGPNEDKRRLKPDQDLAVDLLRALARQHEGRALRLVRSVQGIQFEFVHDQMNAYLAACWLSGQTGAEQEDMLKASKLWQEVRTTQQVVWGFLSQMLDRDALEKLWRFAAGDGRREALQQALQRRALAEGWPLVLTPESANA